MATLEDAPTVDDAPIEAAAGSAVPGITARAFVFVATLLVIIALAVLPLLTPFFVHPALDAAGAPGRLGLGPSETHALSDRSVEQLVLGPGTFEVSGPDGAPFYDDSERRHLAEARLLLWTALVAGAIAAVVLLSVLGRGRGPARAAMWRTIGRAGASAAIAVIVLGVIGLVAFDSLFTLFHQVFFPAGNWAFDPTSQRLVLLYPFGFWQIAAGALGALVLVLGLGAWLMGRTLARRDADTSPAADDGRR